MLTQCPNCETIFRISATELASAQGFVECGECATQFNALERLADEPDVAVAEVLPPVEPSPQQPELSLSFVNEDVTSNESPTEEFLEPATQTDEVFDEPDDQLEPNTDDIQAITTSDEFIDFDTPIDHVESPPPDLGESAEADNLSETPIALDSGWPESTAPQLEPEPPSLPHQELSESDHAILFTEPEDEFAAPHEDLPAPDPDPELSDVPAVLADDISRLNAARPRSPWRPLWTLVALVLMLTVVAQLAWIFRLPLLERYPDLYHAFDVVCERIGCEITAAKEPQAIELLARDVRDHPRYVDALLVNATLISRSKNTTAFPVIELGLYGQTGEIIGVRRFDPQEYLDKSIDMNKGMPPNRPVYIVMEIAGVGKRAVSFEFNFL